jgi:phosphopantetheine--protein transferase-like protein
MIGVDLVYIPEFEKQLKLGGQTFLNKVFNKSELKDKETNHLAGLWAAKEAAYKAADKQPTSIKEIKIKIFKCKPIAFIEDTAYEISISHHNEYAIAVALRKT